jgi:hypothetical protein
MVCLRRQQNKDIFTCLLPDLTAGEPNLLLVPASRDASSQSLGDFNSQSLQSVNYMLIHPLPFLSLSRN